jgi:DNA primase large subunit
MYQVEHISGGGGTEYTPPSCMTMKTYGLCVNRDFYCKNVSHPLSYYRSRKKASKKDAAKNEAKPRTVPGTPENDRKDEKNSL